MTTHKRAQKSLPVLVGKDSDSKWLSAYTVLKKGYDPYSFACVIRDIDHSGYNKLMLKGDQENSMKDIIEAIKRERAEDINVIKEQSSVGEQ